MEGPLRVDLIFGIGTTFLPLYSCSLFGSLLIFPCAKSNPFHLVRCGLGALGSRALCYA